MRRLRLVAPSTMLLLLAVLHAPRPAQALLFDFVPATFFDLSANEPVMLILTGLALLTLGRIGAHPTRRREEPRDRMPAPRALRAARQDPDRHSRSTRRVA